MGQTGVRQQGARLDSLTALRAFAALLVFGQHARFLFAHTGAFASVDRYLSRGGTGVGFFFVLSGFVLAWSRRPVDGRRQFFDRRASRIYPDYLVVWILWSVLIAAGIARAVSVGPALVNLLLLQAWFPAAGWHYGMNGVSWSLSCEAFFYLCFPFIVGALAALSPKRTRAAVVALVVAAVAIQIALHLLEPQLGAERMEWLAYVFPPTRLIEFVLGILLAGLVRQGLPRIPLGAAAVVAVVSVAVAGWMPFPLSHVAITLVPFMILIAAAAQADLAGTSVIGRSRVLIHLGLVSYAFYLLHATVLWVFEEHYGLPARPLWMAVVLVVVLLAVSIAVAEALYQVVERPVERRWRELTAATPKATDSALAPAPAALTPAPAPAPAPAAAAAPDRP